MTGNGLLAGLVGITAGCAVVTPPWAIVIGLISGVLVVFSVEFFDRVAKVDDPVGAVSVHGVCGAFGTLAVAVFAAEGNAYDVGGLLSGGGTDQLVSQVIGVVSIAAWVSITSILMFGLIKAIVGLRVSEEEELAGLDILEHGAPGYGEGFGSFVAPRVDQPAPAEELVP
jgi:Amt family ammonium transporter